MKRSFVLLALLLATSAQSPAPTSLRHLVYKLSVVNHNTSETISYSGMDANMSHSGHVGTVTVDVLALANDGGIVARAYSQYEQEPRPTQTVTCAIYSDGRVICPPEIPVPPEINLLFSMLGRYFYDPTKIAADGTWSTSYANDIVKVSAHFTRKSAPDADPVSIDDHVDILPKNDLQSEWHSDGHIVYEAAMSIPQSIHDAATAKLRTGNTEWVTTDLTLLSDSFAKKN